MACLKQTTRVFARERKPNFSDAEIKVILEGVSEHKDILSQVVNCTAVNQQKEDVYRKIAERVNQITQTEYGGSVVRKVKEVKKKWMELKSSALRIHNSRQLKNSQQMNYIPKEGPFTQTVLNIVLSENSETEHTADHVGLPVESAVNEKHLHGHNRENKEAGLQINVTPEHTKLFATQEGTEYGQMSVKIEPVETSTDIIVEASPSSSDAAPKFSSSSGCASGVAQENFKRERKQNFTHMEIATLLKEVNKYRDTILMKSQNIEMTREKHLKWQQIVQQCHLTSGMNRRSVSEIRKKWMNLKLAALKDKEAREKTYAEGKTIPAVTSPFTEQVLAILQGSFDDGSVTEIQEVDFQAMLTWDASSEPNEIASQHSDEDHFGLNDCSVGSCTRNEGDANASFSHAEIMCLLKEVDKHFKMLTTNLETDQTDTCIQKHHWQMITSKVNACSDRAILRTWRDVRTMFETLKLKAKATECQGSRYKTSPYSKFILDIFKGTTAVTKSCYSKGERTPASSDRTLKKSSRECRSPLKLSETVGLSTEECECLVSEVGRYKDILLTAVSSDTDDPLHGRQHETWRLITEKVNKVLAREVRWTAEKLQLKLTDLQQIAEKHQATMSSGHCDNGEPELSQRILQVLGTLEVGKTGDTTDFTQAETGDQPSAGYLGGVSHGTDSAPEHDAGHECEEREVSNSKHANDNFEGDVNSSADDVQVSDYLPKSEMPADEEPVIRSSVRARKNSKPWKYTFDPGDVCRPRRERDRNFSREELEIMLDIYEANKDVLNSRKIDVETNNRKLFIWQNMVDKINKLTDRGVTTRTVAQVRTKLKGLKRDAMKSWLRCKGALADGRPPILENSFMERIINIMDCDEMNPNNFEIYQDIAVYGDERQKDSGSYEKTTNSVAVKEHLSSLVRICVQLKELGVDAGVVVFEENNMLCCGSDRLKNMAKHRLLPDILSGQHHSNTNTSPDSHSDFENWTVNMIKTSTSTSADTALTLNTKNSSPQAVAQLMAPTIAAESSPSTSGQSTLSTPIAVDPANTASQKNMIPSLTTEESVSVKDTDKDSVSPTTPVMDYAEEAGIASDQLATQTSHDQSTSVEGSVDEADRDSYGRGIDIGSFEENISFLRAESEQGTDIKQRLKAMLQRRSIDTDMQEIPDVTVKEEEEEEEEGGGKVEEDVRSEAFQPQQITSKSSTPKISIACHICTASFSSLSSFLLHNIQHHGFEKISTEDRKDEANQKVRKETVIMKNSEISSKRIDQNARGKPRSRKLGAVCLKKKMKRTNLPVKKTVPLPAQREWAEKHGGIKLKNPVVLLQKLPSEIVKIVSASHKEEPGEKPDGQSSMILDRAYDVGDDGGDSCDIGNIDDELDSKEWEQLLASQQMQPEVTALTIPKEEDADQSVTVNAGVDSRERRFTCDFCDKRFFTASHRRQHVRIHTGEKPFKCDVCGATFTQSNSLRIHKRKHTGERPYSCDLCGYKFYCSSDVLAHKKRRHGLKTEKKISQEDKYRCDLCDLIFSDVSRLRVHKRVHTGEKPFKCDMCDQKFSEKHNLERHRNRHLGIKAYQCEVCGAKFTEKGNLKVHMRYHSGDKPYKCEFCDEAFYVTSTLKIHRRKHTGERPYLCDLCGASFTQGTKLYSHRRSHTGEKPYKCSECGETFKEKDRLNIHLRKHTGIQPYTCRICGKPFQKASHLAVHTRLHTGERPYSCEICGEKFARSDVLGLHRKKHAAVTGSGSGNHSDQSGPSSTSSHLPRFIDHRIQLNVPLVDQSAKNQKLQETSQGSEEESCLDSKLHVQDGIEQTSQLMSAVSQSSDMTPSLVASHMSVLLPGYQYM